MYVKPAEGLKIRDMDLRDHLPAEGREVAPSLYWQRLINVGDVVMSDPPADEPLPEPTPVEGAAA